ncbi:TPA: hypothetical protein ACSA6Q_005171, partial [Escherichia coli]
GVELPVSAAFPVWGRLRYVQSAAKMRIYCHLNGLVMVWLQGSLSSIQHANQKLHQKHNL